MKNIPTDWTEEDLQHLIGQPESFTLEFHESRVCMPGKNFTHLLARDISAFANSEGGRIVLGIQESRGRPRMAIEGDEGIDPKLLSLDQLRYMAEISVRPAIKGIQCHAILLSGKRAGRVVYVIAIPKGDTAYQANDYIYYGRNGFRSEPLPDHLVRLIMLRGATATASLEVDHCEILTKDEYDQCRFHLIVVNNGQRSIEDFLLSVSLSVSDDTLQLWAPTLFVDNEDEIRNELKSVESMLEIGEDIEEYKRHEMLQGPGIPFQSGDELRCSFRRMMQLLYHVDSKKIFPQDRLIFPGGKWLIESVPHAAALAAYRPLLRWTIYLDNALPCAGEINLAECFQSHQQFLENLLE
ncbi:predicted transcriptional regulator [Candidatus Vecturithrix granuli]|uniref:Predicted transcriptional regulator n=1 Tax=Vecturithrix granuli TaxID=1499967 RepID=A0A081C1L8_VECG1|nr:predicted transcriptional regulator [Candidatus Vecturithrix granuli]